VEIPEDNMAESFEQRFGWFAVVNRITQDDVTKHPAVLQGSLVGALNQLFYLVEKDKEIEKRMKQQMKTH
jgi:hypothetical protein